ncbi:excalibur calcium-binding domain-containing protein [Planococcus sp. N028]|uniref:Excalibur calcium-binding domain-containing protein n=1 Tax=Planococcus shixiaomingii TaxID=3058393 RepID=A0ABT8MZ67_9BACL|nr:MULTISPECIES: excalibur calcium-binding domain-containing protein [unclassified Planococcus (in: firmicutes)]MDN7240931.1 excalibur calcium-binding domain-containing protein [Planococcus sp. N028]WKA53189.1 excalibur calcium-binding domain-containing protein [Planococcus sp. N022]
MKKLTMVLLSATIAFSFTYSVAPVESVDAKTKVYANCKAVNKDYKGGIARTSSVKNKGGKTNYKPYVSKALYDANKSRDRDKDLIACER